MCDRVVQKVRIVEALNIEYLLHAEGEKRELFFRRNKIFFYGKTQREFSYLTSEASLVSEFKLSFAIKKILLSQKKFTLNTFSMQHVALCHIFRILRTAFVWIGAFRSTVVV